MRGLFRLALGPGPTGLLGLRRHAIAFAAAGVTWLAASAAGAAVLTSATWSQVTYWSHFREGFPMTRTGAQLGATGSIGIDAAISVSLSYPQLMTQFLVPRTANDTLDLWVTITQGGPQHLTANPSMAGATMGVPGTVVVRTAVHDTMGVSQSTWMAGPNTLVRIPLSVAGGRQSAFGFTIIGYQHFMTVDFYDWTHGSVAFTGLTSSGFPLPDVVAMGTFHVDGTGSNGQGLVTLVAPTKIHIDGPLLNRRSVSLTTLQMQFVPVPEPGTLLLLGAGGAALALYARWSRR